MDLLAMTLLFTFTNLTNSQWWIKGVIWRKLNSQMSMAPSWMAPLWYEWTPLCAYRSWNKNKIDSLCARCPFRWTTEFASWLNPEGPVLPSRVMPPLHPVSVTQKNQPSTMLSCNVQSIDLPMDCTAWPFFMTRQSNGCSTSAPRSCAAKQWIVKYRSKDEDEVQVVLTMLFVRNKIALSVISCVREELPSLNPVITNSVHFSRWHDSH